MFLAEKTVKNYVSHLLLRLDMRGRTEAAVVAADCRSAWRPASERRLAPTTLSEQR
jgi:hypothetical protein